MIYVCMYALCNADKPKECPSLKYIASFYFRKSKIKQEGLGVFYMSKLDLGNGPKAKW